MREADLSLHPWPAAWAYLVRRFWQAGKQHKAYIRKADVVDAMAGIEAWQRLHPPSWTMRQLLAELRRIEEEVLQ